MIVVMIRAEFQTRRYSQILGNILIALILVYYLNTKGFILTLPDIFAEYLDCDFYMYVYGTLLEILERYFEIEASRVSHLFLK